jgi:hypothetical protein
MPVSFSSPPLKFYIPKVLTVDIFRDNLMFFCSGKNYAQATCQEDV